MIPAARPIIGDTQREALYRLLNSGLLSQGPKAMVAATGHAVGL